MRPRPQVVPSIVPPELLHLSLELREWPRICRAVPGVGVSGRSLLGVSPRVSSSVRRILGLVQSTGSYGEPLSHPSPDPSAPV